MKDQPVGAGLCQGVLSDLLVVCSALSSFEDALDQAVYEEIDYLVTPVSYTHLTLPTTGSLCRSRWSPYH